MKKEVKTLVLSAIFLAIGIVLPFLTGQLKEIGDTLLPMHLPVMLCGAICGGWYGFATGLLMPLLRGAMFGMPPLFPNAIWMAAELATYGAVCGFLYRKTSGRIYLSLIVAMLAGRIVWGIAKALLLGVNTFTVNAFIVGGIIDAIPGIVIQLVLVPIIVKLLKVR